MDEIRIVLYSHDSVGLGHLRRNLALAHALAARLPALTGRKVTGLIVTGEPSAPTYQHPDGFDFVVLPGIRKRDGDYAPRQLDVQMSQLRDLRAQVLEAALVGFAPHLVIIDRHPFGVRGELRSGLQTLRARVPRAKVVLGLRDVLDEPAVVEREWAGLDAAALRSMIDEVWVYGDPTVHDLRETGELPATLADRAVFTGFLSAGRPSGLAPEVAEPYVVTMAGGGSDGGELTRVAAAADVPAGYQHIVVTGPQMADRERRLVERAAGRRTRVLATVDDGLALLRRASAAVIMGGYNTVAEAMATDIPALIVPRTKPRLEQAIRADALTRAGLFESCPHPDVDILSDWLRSAVTRSVDRSGADRFGLGAVAPRAAELLRSSGGALDPELAEDVCA